MGGDKNEKVYTRNCPAVFISSGDDGMQKILFGK